MSNFPFFWHELATAADMVSVWKNVVNVAGMSKMLMFMNQGVPDPTIGRIGGAAPGSTCWHVVCYGFTNNGAAQPLAFHTWGSGALPADLLALANPPGGWVTSTGTPAHPNVIHLADGTFFRVFQLDQGGF